MKLPLCPSEQMRDALYRGAILRSLEGRMASPPGSQATPGAAKASPPPVSIPCAGGRS